MLRLAYAPHVTTLALGSALAIALALASVSPAGGQGPDVQIAQLDCISDPELVVIGNVGDMTQDFTGWELQSDPASSEVFDLSLLNSLPPGASITIQSGPSASGVFKWSNESIFRDDDATDYVRLVDDTGAIVQQVNCAEATPTPLPTDTDGDGLSDEQEQQLGTDANDLDTDGDGVNDGDEVNVHGTDPLDATSAPVGEIPNGGGPPPVAGGAAWPTITLLIGGSIAAAGVAMIVLPKLLLSPTSTAEASSPQRESRGGNVTRRDSPSIAFGLALAGLAVAVVLHLLWRRES